MLTEYGKVLKKLRVDENETLAVMHAYHLSIVRFFTFAEADSGKRCKQGAYMT
jgi:hypothetical protein